MGAARPGATALTIAALIGIFLLLPLIAVIPVSFTPTRYLSIPTGHWSLRHYDSLLTDPKWWQGVWLSIRIGFISSIVATALALLFSLGIWMLRPTFRTILMAVVLLPMVAPPVVSSVTLYFFLTSLSQINSVVAYDTLPGVALSHAVMTAPFAVVLSTAALSQIDRRIDLAARSMGAGLWTRMYRIILPNIRFTVLAALFMTFVLSWEEISVTIFITSFNTLTLPRLMWMGLRDNVDPAIAAISVILIVLVVLGVLVRHQWQRIANRLEIPAG
jgi:putative spermidine/putrescine transport system permease protein